ncbi:MAG TPA: hypothetical protein VGX70_03390 [Gemmataceae bacterium]|jgi:hypothetical protein|nr:hypothetical protein [Gemmataceae bacterium]
MAPEELRDTLRRSPFEPFRLVMTDGTGYDIRHPDLMWVGRRSAMIGLTGDPGQTLYERSVKVDLLHVIRLEPLQTVPPSSTNGPGS